MKTATRRDALRRTAGAGVLAALAPGAGGARAAEQPDDALKIDRECVVRSGMTEDEADCWELAARLAGKFFELPQLHPMDKQEVATAIHVIQNKLLSRPTYRRYREEVKKAHSK